MKFELFENGVPVSKVSHKHNDNIFSKLRALIISVVIHKLTFRFCSLDVSNFVSQFLHGSRSRQIDDAYIDGYLDQY